MTTQPDSWSGVARAYQTAVVVTDVHTAHCPVCATGAACGRADELMTNEFHEIETWRRVDPTVADTYDRATWPQPTEEYTR